MRITENYSVSHSRYNWDLISQKWFLKKKELSHRGKSAKMQQNASTSTTIYSDALLYAVSVHYRLNNSTELLIRQTCRGSGRSPELELFEWRSHQYHFVCLISSPFIYEWSFHGNSWGHNRATLLQRNVSRHRVASSFQWTVFISPFFWRWERGGKYKANRSKWAGIIIIIKLLRLIPSPCVFACLLLHDL